MQVTKQFRAEIAHRLPNHPGACRHIHGHSYKFQITVEGGVRADTGMVLDFKDLKNDIEEAIGHWDHSLILYVQDPLAKHFQEIKGLFPDAVSLIEFPYIPTAENMAEYIGEHMLNAYNVVRVCVWETTTSCAEWTKEVRRCSV